MNYKTITYPDVNNGIGLRVTLWLQGCSHHCFNCQNPMMWDENGGKKFDETVKEQLFELLSKPYIKGLTLSGGDPLYSIKDLVPLLEEVKANFPEKNIWLYTGFTLKQILINKYLRQVLDYVDVIVDGKFDNDLKDISIAFRGSTNQNIWEKRSDNTWCVNNNKYDNV